MGGDALGVPPTFSPLTHLYRSRPLTGNACSSLPVPFIKEQPQNQFWLQGHVWHLGLLETISCPRSTNGGWRRGRGWGAGEQLGPLPTAKLDRSYPASPRVPQWGWVPGAHSGCLFENTPLTGFLLLSTSCPHFFANVLGYHIPKQHSRPHLDRIWSPQGKPKVKT